MRLPKRFHLYHIGLRRPCLVLAVSTALALLSLVGALRLRLIGDMTSLLPQETESVRDLNTLKENFGGTNPLYVTIESESPETAGKFADDFAKRLEANPSVVHVDYRRPVEFFRKRQWLYFDLEDLKEMEQRVDRALSLEKKGVSTIFSSLMDFASDEDRPDLTFQDIIDRYEKKVEWVSRETLSDTDGRLLVLRVRINNQAEEIDASRRILEEIRTIETATRRSLQDPPVTVGYTGNHATKLEIVDQVRFEVGWISALVSAALLIILISYFRSGIAAFLVGLPLLVSVFWAGGLVYLLLGHVNLITAFGAAILGGLGSDYGIYLLTRFFQERKNGRDLPTACELAFARTGRATFASMITTVGAFLALLLSDFGLFRELGLVGATGLIATYVAMMTVLPALLTLRERWRGSTAIRSEGRTLFHSPIFLPWRKGVILLLIVLLGLSAAATLPYQARIQYEDDSLDAADLPSNRVYDKVSNLLNASLSPTVLVADNANEENQIVRGLEERIRNDHSKSLVFNQVVGLSSFIPERQEEKRLLLSRLADKYKSVRLVLKPQKKEILETIHDAISAGPVTVEQLPAEIVRLFTSPAGKELRLVYLFPAFPRSTSEEMERYQEGVRSAKRDLGLRFAAADSSFVAADTVRLIRSEASRGMVFVLLFLGAVLVILTRPVSRAFAILAHLLVSLVFLSGLLWLARIPLNVINIAMIPIVLGTGIDCFIHFYHRYRETGTLKETIPNEIPPMLLSNLTSMVGFGGLILSSSPGVRSVGWVAVLGLLIMALVGTFVFPRVLALLEERDRLSLPKPLVLSAEPDS